MAVISNLVIDLITVGARESDPERVGLAFFSSLRPLGAMAINARGYQSTKDLTATGQIFARLAPDHFMPVYRDRRYYKDNPTLSAAQRRSRPFLWSDLAWTSPEARWVRNTARDCGCSDGIVVPCHGPSNYLGAVSIAFERLPDLAPAQRSAIELASYFLHERMKELAGVEDAKPAALRLTPREHDCLAFVADGLTDPEIADVLGVSANTVALHIKNARLKLGARTRAQAVARYVMPSF